ncbi:MAG TPA: CBS domain-containing protein [Pirellulales bacterium]|nr:CBS domain-containing protein [Pirellulales bacterium]
MRLQDILRVKGAAVHTISPEATLDDVVQKLIAQNCGSLVVCDEALNDGCSEMVGIITERDILRFCAARRGPLDGMHVKDVMTREPTTGTPYDTIEDTMGLMTEQRIRQLPILDEGRLAGIISIGDVVKAHYDQVALENHYLKSYIQS